MQKRARILFAMILLGSILAIFGIIRYSLPHQLDDVTPNRFCEGNFVNESKILMVIPLPNNQSIADNQTWCNYLRGLNKTIGMHGVYHTENEFERARSKEYIRLGMEEFRKCFGFYPTLFEAPKLSLSKKNKLLLNSLNFSIISVPYYITHKVYHCTDYEKKSWLVWLNKLNQFI